MALPMAALVVLLLLVAAGGSSGAGGSPGDAGFSFGTMIGCAPPTPEASASAQAEAAASFRAGLAPLLAALPSAAAATGFASLPCASGSAGAGARALGVCFGPAAPSEPGCKECLRAAVAAAFEGCADDVRGAGAWRPGCAVAYADGDGASLADEDGDARPRFAAGGMDSSYLDTLEQRLADLAKALAHPKRRPLWKMALSVLFYVLATIGAVAVVFFLCAFVAGCLFAESLFRIMDAAGQQLGNAAAGAEQGEGIAPSTSPAAMAQRPSGRWRCSSDSTSQASEHETLAGDGSPPAVSSALILRYRAVICGVPSTTSTGLLASPLAMFDEQSN